MLVPCRMLSHKASDQVLFDHYRALAMKSCAGASFAVARAVCREAT